jgi:hypothetical protein
MEGFMRFAAVVAVFLISGSMALAQKIKQPTVHEPPAHGVSVHHSAAPPPAANASAAQLAKIEQQSARVKSNKLAHQPSSSVKATPALDLGKNKPVRAAGSPHRTTTGHQ